MDPAGELKVVAGARIELATQGFSVLVLTVRNFSDNFTFVQLEYRYNAIMTGRNATIERTVYDNSENRKWNRSGTD